MKYLCLLFLSLFSSNVTASCNEYFSKLRTPFFHILQGKFDYIHLKNLPLEKREFQAVIEGNRIKILDRYRKVQAYHLLESSAQRLVLLEYRFAGIHTQVAGRRKPETMNLFLVITEKGFEIFQLNSLGALVKLDKDFDSNIGRIRDFGMTLYSWSHPSAKGVYGSREVLLLHMEDGRVYLFEPIEAKLSLENQPEA